MLFFRRDWSQNRVKAGHKPGSVHLLWGWMIIYLGLSLPTASSGSLEGTLQMASFVPWPCSQPGFTKPAPLDAAGALLPHLCTLACALRKTSEFIGGVFLWHYPHGHPHWVLPSKLDHCGARTFLNREFIAEMP